MQQRSRYGLVGQRVAPFLPRVGVMGAGGGAWTPGLVPSIISASVAGGNAYTDAAKAVQCATAGDLVRVWADRNGSNDYVQATAGLRPTYQFDGTRPVIRFDSADDRLNSTAGQVAGGASATLEVMIRFRFVTIPGGARAGVWGQGNDQWEMYHEFSPSGMTIRMRDFGGTYRVPTGMGDVVAGTWYTAGIRTDGTTVTATINAVTGTAATTGGVLVSANTTMMGGTGNSGQGNVEVSGYIVSNAILSAADRAAAVAYLGAN